MAPTALVLGNIGIVQARATPTNQLNALVRTTGADALCVHLNPAMEVVQPEGDTDFRGGLGTLIRLIDELDVPIIVKETGCGLSRGVGKRLADIGIQWVDTSGAGGTSWVAVETQRAQDEGRALGEAFWDWGVPTGASVAQLSGLGMGVCATGGVSSGLHVARSLALGATCAGVARPFLQAQARGGRAEVSRVAKQIIEEIRIACLLTGSRTPADLRHAAIVLGPNLSRWVPRGSPLAERL